MSEQEEDQGETTALRAHLRFLEWEIEQRKRERLEQLREAFQMALVGSRLGVYCQPYEIDPRWPLGGPVESD